MCQNIHETGERIEVKHDQLTLRQQDYGRMDRQPRSFLIIFSFLRPSLVEYLRRMLREENGTSDFDGGARQSPMIAVGFPNGQSSLDSQGSEGSTDHRTRAIELSI